MANFFGKATAATASPSKSVAPKEGGSPRPTNSRSDFQRTFRPFVLKKDADLAPINWFRERRQRERWQRVPSRTEGNAIVIDDEDEDKDANLEDVEMVNTQEPESQTPQGTLRSVGSCVHLPKPHANACPQST